MVHCHYNVIFGRWLFANSAYPLSSEVISLRRSWDKEKMQSNASLYDSWKYNALFWEIQPFKRKWFFCFNSKYSGRISVEYKYFQTLYISMLQPNTWQTLCSLLMTCKNSKLGNTTMPLWSVIWQIVKPDSNCLIPFYP